MTLWHTDDIGFNPRSHEGSDKTALNDCKLSWNVSIHVISLNGTFNSYVSIHAPTKGATTLDAPYIVDKCVSIHAPTKGATYNSDMSKIDAQMFQSTLPRRERHKKIYTKTDYSRVSIHAPTKGATTLILLIYQNGSCFNPRSHEGSDSLRCTAGCTPWCFNPRSHEGSDGKYIIQTTIQCMFQSTLPRRERRQCFFHLFRNFRFQSTLPRRERQITEQKAWYYYLFQSTLPRRERLLLSDRGGQKNGFQSTLPRRERHQGEHVLRPSGNVSIHAPTKGATGDLYKTSVTKQFQSTLPRRERHIMSYGITINKWFQSTLPRRERQESKRNGHVISLFQSTLPRRERRHPYQIYTTLDTFQSTLPRRERLLYCSFYKCNWRFQSTLPRRERPQFQPKIPSNFQL